MVEALAGVGRWRLDLATGVSVWSDALYEIHGVDRNAFEPTLPAVLAQCDKADRPRIMAAIEAATLSGGGFDLEYRARRPSGEYRHVICKAIAELDDANHPIALVGVSQDVTDRTVRLRVHQKESERYRLLSEDLAKQMQIADELARRAAMAEQIAGLGHWRLDAATGEVTWSANMYEIYGLDASAPLDLEALLDMTDPQDQLKGRQKLAEVLATGADLPPSLTRIRRLDGEVRWVRGTMAADRGHDGAIRGALGTILDVTDYQTLLHGLQASEAEARTPRTPS